MTQVIKLTETEAGVLNALRIYRYLTAGQMLRVGVCRDQAHLYAVLRDLSAGKRPIIGKLAHGLLPGVGRLPNLFYLTEQGAKLLAAAEDTDLSAISYPHGVVLIRNHFQHRLNSIDCEIAIRQWTEQNDAALDYYYQYFNVTGANRSKTKDRIRSMTKIDMEGSRHRMGRNIR